MSGYNFLDYFYQMFSRNNKDNDMEISSNSDMEISSSSSNNVMSISSNNSNKVYTPPFTPSFILTKDNARVHLMIQKETWGIDDNYNIEPFVSDIRIAALYKQYDKNVIPAPTLLTRKLLCIGLRRLLNDRNSGIKKKSIIVLEADPSKNDNLIKKVYLPMYFELIAPGEGVEYNSNNNTNNYKDFGKGGLMKSTVGRTIQWCNEKQWE